MLILQCIQYASLHEAGVPVTINSDDPPLFNTTLNGEAKLLFDPFDFEINTIDEILLNGIRYSFMPVDGEANTRSSDFEAEMTKLQQELCFNMFVYSEDFKMFHELSTVAFALAASISWGAGDFSGGTRTAVLKY